MTLTRQTQKSIQLAMLLRRLEHQVLYLMRLRNVYFLMTNEYNPITQGNSKAKDDPIRL